MRFDDRIYRIRIRKFIDASLFGDLFHDNNSKQFDLALEFFRPDVNPKNA